MTTNELIKQVLDRDAKATPGPWDAMETGRETYVRERAATDGAVIAYADATGEPTASEYALIAAYRTAAPLLARKMQRAMEVVAYALDSDGDGMYLSCADIACPKGEPFEHSGHCIVKRAADALREIEAME